MKFGALDAAILAVAATNERGVSLYDLQKGAAELETPLLGASSSNIRNSLKALADNAYLDERESEQSEPGLSRRVATRYVTNLRGKTALADWAEGKPFLPAVNATELQTRIRALPVVGPELTLEALEQVNDMLSERLVFLRPPELGADNELASRLEYDLLHVLYWAYLQWLDRTIRDLSELVETRIAEGDPVALRRRTERQRKRLAQFGDSGQGTTPRKVKKRRAR